MNLHDIARSLIKDGKGILIADEGTHSGSALFVKSGVTESDETYARYRELLATTEGIEEYLSAVMLPKDAFASTLADGTPLYDALAAKDIRIGMTGGESDASSLPELKSSGVVCAMYTITRAVQSQLPDIADRIRSAIEFAKNCHSLSLVPILAVDVASVGPHTAGQAEDALVETLALFGDALESSGMDQKSVIVASSMASSGSDNPLQAKPDEVAERTVRAVTASVPGSLAGVLFLSDSETPEDATANFNAIARTEPLPWPVAFAFSDAFEAPVIDVWRGIDENRLDAQSVFAERLALLKAADGGGYSKGMEESNLS